MIHIHVILSVSSWMMNNFLTILHVTSTDFPKEKQTFFYMLIQHSFALKIQCNISLQWSMFYTLWQFKWMNTSLTFSTKRFNITWSLSLFLTGPQSFINLISILWKTTFCWCWLRCGRDHTIAGFTTTCAISAYHH